MSVEAMTWAYAVPLPPCPKSVLVALANRADEDGYCWPGLNDLELRTGWTRRAIQNAIRYLEHDVKLLSMSPRYAENGDQISNMYKLTITRSAGAPPRAAGAPPRAAGAPPRAAGAPEYSEEQSEEQSEEDSPHSPPLGGAILVMDACTADFHEFWKAYPKKTGKKAAWRAWQKARDRPPLSEILLAIERAKTSRDWKRGYIPNPSTWLHQGRWSDEEMPTHSPPTSMVELIGMGGLR